MPRDDTINLASRRALFYPAAEIYASAPSGFWDFGPDGETLRRKIIDFWRRELVEREGFVEIYGCQILPEDVFKASGHLENFNDPIVQCGKCHALHRADKIIEEKTNDIVPESLSDAEMDALIAKHKVVCPKCKGSLKEVRRFNMMMKVDIGATGNQPCYLRPETCQSIFLDFPRVYKTMRKTLPLGIAQAGASFRNEIAPRNTLLRERELGQMEIEVFFNPKKINEMEKFSEVGNYKINLLLVKNSGKTTPMTCKEAVEKQVVSGQLIAYYIARVQQAYNKLGIPVEKIRFRELGKDARAFYAKETWDFEVETDLGWIEIMACNYRTDYDLKRHGAVSKQDLSVNEDGEKFIPHVFELSAGIDRTFYVTVDLAFRKEKRGTEERIFLDLNPKIAPYFVGIFPLVKKDGLYELAEKITNELIDYEFDVFFDEKGSIGKRYARTDEIGVPFGITIDYQTKEDKTVTLRERNSMEQRRVKVVQLPELLWKLKVGKTKFSEITQ